MNAQPNRLPAEGDHRFKGSEIDRQRPLRFRLDGHLIHGFAGDTVLSAALASGLIAAGWRGGEPLALDERFAPLVRLAQRRRGAVADALPMARMPAILRRPTRSAQVLRAEIARSMAPSCRAPVAVSPSPRRTMRE